jgi:YesN/AraC family two-component response regulator
MTALLKSMQQEFLGADRHRLLFLQSLLRMMIILLNRNILASGTAARVPSTDADHVNLYFELVQKHFITKKKVSDYARMMSIPASYLNVVVKRTSGNTAKHFIRQQIVLEAKRLATWEGKNLKETAYLLGYEDVAHFSKFFKQAAGITFSAFRRAQDR